MSFYREQLENWLKKIDVHADKILDIGAHLGNMALEMKGIWPYTNILCVEANPYAEEELKAKDLNYKIAALSWKSGDEKDFWVSTEWLLSSGNSLYRENTPSYSDDKCKTIKVMTHTLDELFPNGESFDFIKIDTQGSECDILIGGQELLKKTKYILTEASVREYNKGGCRIHNIFSVMKQMGFELDDICSLQYKDNLNIALLQTDLLFKKEQ